MIMEVKQGGLDSRMDLKFKFMKWKIWLRDPLKYALQRNEESSERREA